MKKRAVLYARVSGDDTKKDGANLAGQLELCRTYAQERDLDVVAEFAEDERGVSGARWDAPELYRALEMAKRGEYDLLILREIDRFARNLAKQLVLEEQFKRAGVNVIYVLEEYADTPEGRLNKHIRATIAEYEREKIRERTVRAKRRAARQGKVMLHGSGPPYGYSAVKINNRITLEIDEDEARIIRLIFDWYTQERLSMRAIARRLTEMRIPTPADSPKRKIRKKRKVGEWVVATIANILTMETYIGTWRYGKYNSATNTSNPKAHQIEVPVPAIVSQEKWDAAQARKKKNKKLAARNTRYDYLLRGLLRCGECGAGVAVNAMSRNKAKPNLYYVCRATRKGTYRHHCRIPHFRADRVDPTVWEWIEELLRDPKTIRKKAKKYQEKKMTITRPKREQLAVIDSLIAKEKERLELSLDLYLEGDLMQDMLIDRKNRSETEIKSLENDRAILEAELEAELLTDEQINSLEGIATLIGEGIGLANANFEERRYTVETLNIKGELLMIDGKQHIKISCYLGEEILNASTTCRNC